MNTADWIALLGIFATLLVALLTLAWTIYVHRQTHKSPGAEKLVDDRRRAVLGVRQLASEFNKAFINAMHETTRQAREGGPEPGMMNPLVAFSARGVVQYENWKRDLAEYLHKAEAEQFAALCKALLDSLVVLKHRYGANPDSVMNMTRVFEAIREIEEWALHLAQVASIDKYLKGQPVVHTKPEDKK